MKTFIQNGERLPWLNNTVSDVVSGQVVVVEPALGSMLGIAEVDIPSASLVTNGDFAADSDWTKGGTWTIAAGVATRTASASGVDLSQSIASLAAGPYHLIFRVTAVTASSITAVLGQGSASAARSATGIYSQVIVAGTGDLLLAMRANASFAGSIDNVVLYSLDTDTANEAVPGCVGIVNIGRNVVTAPKVAGNAWTSGEKLTWDLSEAAFDSSAAITAANGDISGNAVAFGDALSASTTGSVLLNVDVGTVEAG
jgi:predicted RecA/RadA family phage recombinase